MRFDPIKLTIIFFALCLNISCATLSSRDAVYNEAIQDAQSGSPDFAFIKLTNYLKDNPNPDYVARVKFAIGEYYLQISNYRQAIDELSAYVLDYPREKNNVFAQALLYKAVTEYKGNPAVTDKIKKAFFSNSVFLVFSDARIRKYRSILNNTYKIADYVNRIEVTRNDELILTITP